MPEENNSANHQNNDANQNINNNQSGNSNGDNNDGDSGNPTPEDSKVEISEDELKKLKSDAGRWQKHRTDNRNNSKQKRSWEKDGAGDGDDSTESLELRKSREEASSAQQEVFQLRLDKKLVEILDREEYKNISQSVKTLLKKNPASLVDKRSTTIDDAELDIQDFLDSELENLVETKIPTSDSSNDQTPPTPPANSSRPTATKSDKEESIEGKTGAKRSTTVLKNLLLRSGIHKE